VAGSRIRTWHLMPTERMGPPPGALPPMRMTASWSGSNDPTAYKSVTRRCTQWRALLGSSADRQPSDAGALQKAPVAVHHRSACSGVKALRNTSPARRQAAKLCYRFGPLTPSARSANLIAGDGTRNGCLAPNKEPVTNQKHDLTGKAPYRFESVSLQLRVRCELLRSTHFLIHRKTCACYSARNENVACKALNDVSQPIYASVCQVGLERQ
jgi:hypothetical protein